MKAEGLNEHIAGMIGTVHQHAINAGGFSADAYILCCRFQYRGRKAWEQ